MSSDQCAQNPDGSLKDAKDIQWFYDPEDAQPLSSTPAPAQPLGRGLRKKTTTRFSDAVAREQLGSDEDGPDAFAKPPRRKRATRVSNISGCVARPELSSRNPHEILPVESSDGDEDETFQLDSGSGSAGDSGDESTDLEPISHNEVRVQLLSQNLECLSNTLVACRCSVKEDGCGPQPCW
jgi:hypothetical protein